MEKAREIAIQICEEFETILDEYDVTIDTEERQEYMEDLDDDEKETVARLFGTPYYALEDTITKIIEKILKEK